MAEYDEENVGGLELDEIEGARTEKSEIMKQILGEYTKSKEEERQKPPEPTYTSMSHLLESHDGKDKPDMDILELDDGKKEKWDCQSIISTYSNLYNRPKVITENRIKVGIIYDLLRNRSDLETLLPLYPILVFLII